MSLLIILKYKLIYIAYKSKYKLAIIYKYNKTNFTIHIYIYKIILYINIYILIYYIIYLLI